jgi:hypothetical protein
MSYTYNLEPSVPADSGRPSLGASKIRALKNFLQERFAGVFYGFDTAGTETAVGAKALPYISQASDEDAIADGIVTYAKDVASSSELFVKNESDNAIQVTSGTGLKSQSDYTARSSLTAYQAPKDGWIFGTGSTEVRIADNETLDSNLITLAVDGNFCFPVTKGKWYMLYGTAGQSFYFA